MPFSTRIVIVCLLVAGVLERAAFAQTVHPTVGVAFGGGSAKGIAHIGIIQWFEENHIPVDVAAGTSMGGLVGGAFATGMSAAELRDLITSTDWDTMFGSTSFPFKNLRRKEDARSYPSRLEFGLKRGIVPPPALNDGQQVDLLLARIAAPYYGLETFDQLPTPFRVVAVDLRAAEKVVLDRGPLATALRATMSLPGVFPPVERDGHLLVDGGALDNVPADVVRSMGASTVIAIDVGEAPGEVDLSLFGLIGSTVDTMMRAATRIALKDSDLTIKVDVGGFGSLDWRRADELIARGYQAAESHRAELIKHRVSDEDWQRWVGARQARRRTTLPDPSFLATDGVAPKDASIVKRSIEPHLNQPVDIPALERDLSALSGLDRYQSVDWQLTTNGGGQTGILVRAHEKVYAPPFLMMGLNVENTTSENFRVQLAARYLTFDLLGSGSELRIDGGLGADPNLTAALYEPIWGTRLFVRPIVGVNKRTLSIVQDDRVVAEYSDQRASFVAETGVNLSRISEVAGGFTFAHVNDEVRTGDPGLPQMSGGEVGMHVRWVFDSHDNPAIPSRGTRALARLSHIFTSPEAPGLTKTNTGLTQAEVSMASFRRAGTRHRLFAVLTAGTSFGDHPLPTRQFSLGYPYVLDAFSVGEERDDHYGVVTLGVLRQVGRLPDFLGGPIFGGAWLENGAAFNTHENADFHTQIAGGFMTETLVGPVLVAVSSGLDGGWRTIFGIGRIFR